MIENPDEAVAGFNDKINQESETNKNRIFATEADITDNYDFPDILDDDSSGVQSPQRVLAVNQWLEDIDDSSNFAEYEGGDLTTFSSTDAFGSNYRDFDVDEADSRDGFLRSDSFESGRFKEDASIIDPGAVEAILMVATEPVLPSLLAELLETTVEAVDEVCDRLAREYEASGKGFELVKIAGGYRYQSVANYRDYVERFIIQDMPQKLSPAAMETLAIIAYKQPISRAQIATIRGVNVDRVVRVLLQKSLIKEVAKDSGPGQAILFGTTTAFLERLGLNEITDLPPLEEHVPDVATVEALEHVLRDKP